ncbi:MAG TPA: SPOR domain-containing protein [Candidatus Sulfotelmatobacter sp.]|jgi:DedD protein|nr:SPOR domain-containing protein [Candidatus Sulfotelmatobacter sp.]
MASKNKSSGGDFILEGRHLVGLFLLLVVIFGVVFTLGYLMGRSQYDAKLRASVGSPVGFETEAAPLDAKSKARPQPEDAPPPKKNSDWDFYHSAEPQTAPDHLQPPPKPAVAKSSAQPTASSKPATASPKPAKPVKATSGTDSPLIPKGSIILQVAAVLHQDDALALAQALQQKKFPAFVLPPGADKYYRVQVGPYADNPAATKARQDLEDKGFKSIIKR